MISEAQLEEWECAATNAINAGVGCNVDHAVIALINEVRALLGELAQRIVDSPTVRLDPMCVTCATCPREEYVDGGYAIAVPQGWMARMRTGGKVTYACATCLKLLEEVIT